MNNLLTEIRIMSSNPSRRGGVSEERRILHQETRQWRWFAFLLVFCLLTSVLGLPATAQSYSIDWHTIDGGGGTSTGGVYSVSGTIGQPDAGTMSGGNYTLTGGFWGLIAAVQTPGAPLLTVVRSNNAVVVSWPLPADGWMLEWTNALPRVSAPWPQLAPPYQTNGVNLQFTEPATSGSKFFRLHKP